MFLSCCCVIFSWFGCCCYMSECVYCSFFFCCLLNLFNFLFLFVFLFLGKSDSKCTSFAVNCRNWLKLRTFWICSWIKQQLEMCVFLFFLSQSILSYLHSFISFFICFHLHNKTICSSLFHLFLFIYSNVVYCLCIVLVIVGFSGFLFHVHFYFSLHWIVWFGSERIQWEKNENKIRNVSISLLFCEWNKWTRNWNRRGNVLICKIVFVVILVQRLHHIHQVYVINE